MSYVFHTDPGHGWLAVPLADMPSQNLEWISDCSYFDPHTKTLYLEEDCDIRLAPQGWQENFREVHTDRDSHVRRLPRWQAIRTHEERMTRLGFRH